MCDSIDQIFRYILQNGDNGQPLSGSDKYKVEVYKDPKKTKLTIAGDKEK